MNLERLKTQLIRHEDCVLHAYEDPKGYLTIGVGRLIDKRRGGGIDEEEAGYLLERDVKKCEVLAQAFGWYASLNEVRQNVIVEMIFNLGAEGVRGFKGMIAAIERGDFAGTAAEMLDSKWARQQTRLHDGRCRVAQGMTMNEALTTTRLAVCAGLIAAGIAVHFVKKLYDLEQAGTILRPTTYVAQRPYAFALAVLGAYLLAAFWYFIGQLNEVTSIMTGVTCSTAFDTLRARAVARLRNEPETETGVS